MQITGVLKINHPLRALVFVLVIFTCGCKSLVNGSYEYDAPAQKVLLVLIGGNSECNGDKGLWLIRDSIAKDVRTIFGLQPSQLSTKYFSWVGDEGGAEYNCIPLPNGEYLKGEVKIFQKLKPVDPNIPVIIVGWSNGGATAALLSNLPDGHQIDLLVTLDPVSHLTENPTKSKALLQINVYNDKGGTSPDFADRIAIVGGAWNFWKVADMNICIAGHHGDVSEMWNAAITGNEKLDAWTHATNESLSLGPAAHPQTMKPVKRCS